MQDRWQGFASRTAGAFVLASVALLAPTVVAGADGGELGQAGPSGPGAPPAFLPISSISGAATSDTLLDPGELTYNGDLRKVRGQLTELSMDWSVPGLPDTIQSFWNSDEYEVPGAFGRAKIHAGTFLLRDDVGAWAGPFGGVEFADGATDLQATLMGAEGYDGRCAILNALRSSERGWEMDGLVFDCRSMQTMP